MLDAAVMTGMRVTMLGCGPSMGVPMVAHGWGACDAANPRNRRLRPSILIEGDRGKVLVDAGPGPAPAGTIGRPRSRRPRLS